LKSAIRESIFTAPNSPEPTRRHSDLHVDDIDKSQGAEGEGIFFEQYGLARLRGRATSTSPKEIQDDLFKDPDGNFSPRRGGD